MGRVPLHCALALVGLYAKTRSPKSERAALKYLTRYLLSRSRPLTMPLARPPHSVSNDQIESGDVCGREFD